MLTQVMTYEQPPRLVDLHLRCVREGQRDREPRDCPRRIGGAVVDRPGVAPARNLRPLRHREVGVRERLLEPQEAGLLDDREFAVEVRQHAGLKDARPVEREQLGRGVIEEHER